MRILVTGGSGYLGSHLVRVLLARGDEVVVVDDLSAGVRRPLGDARLCEINLTRGADALSDAFVGVDAVVHLAARKSVEESVRQPARYYRENIGALSNVLSAVEEARIPVMLFSSSAAVYGNTSGAAIRETDSTSPINPYGETKLAGEHLTAAATDALGLRSASLRYFNAAGTGWADLADTGRANLVPAVIEQVSRGESPVVFGADYPTADGTCVRDYVHPLDIAEAHVAVLDFLCDENVGHQVFNVATGAGASVSEVISHVSEAAGEHIAPRVVDRRVGDPAEVVANPARLATVVGWRARITMQEIVKSAWEASGHSRTPRADPLFSARR
jgi:UDP-glucose 4-epimerase